MAYRNRNNFDVNTMFWNCVIEFVKQLVKPESITEACTVRFLYNGHAIQRRPGHSRHFFSKPRELSP